MKEKMKCDYCEKVCIIQPVVKDKIERDGLYILCKKCWTERGWQRDRFHGQIQHDHYLSTN